MDVKLHIIVVFILDCKGKEGEGGKARSYIVWRRAVAMAMEAAEFSFLWIKPALVPDDVLRLILCRLPPRLLAIAACVSRSWRSIAGDRSMQVACFQAAWKLGQVVGRPSSAKFWGGGLSQFVFSHPLQRWDTLESLAVKYDVQAMEIRKLNNMVSDYGVYCRNRVLIPISRPQLLIGKICIIEFDEHADCELALVYPRVLQIRKQEGQSSTSNLAGNSSKSIELEEDCKFFSEDRSNLSCPVTGCFSEDMTSRGALAEFSGSSGTGKEADEATSSVVDWDKGTHVDGLDVGIAQPEQCEEGISALTDDLWRLILELLPVSVLGQAACVCRLWYSIAADPAVMAAAFMTPWKLKEVIGRPVSGSFWRGQLGQFAISHALRRQDTIAGLAVKYRVQVPEIRRLNNMMSDHGIHSRERLLIPVSQPELLQGQTCFIETDVYAKREVGVVYLDGSKPNRKEAERATARAQRRLKKEVLESLKRSLRVDDSTAQYYFSLADGDLRGALQEFGEDLRWEHAAQ